MTTAAKKAVVKGTKVHVAKVRELMEKEGVSYREAQAMLKEGTFSVPQNFKKDPIKDEFDSPAPKKNKRDQFQVTLFDTVMHGAMGLDKDDQIAVIKRLIDVL